MEILKGGNIIQTQVTSWEGEAALAPERRSSIKKTLGHIDTTKFHPGS